jgi:hypothetical protein
VQQQHSADPSQSLISPSPDPVRTPRGDALRSDWIQRRLPAPRQPPPVFATSRQN